MNKLLWVLLALSGFYCSQAQNLTQQWASSHSGFGDNSDKFNALIRDASGNIYAAGFTMRQGNGKDFLLVKFNSAGDTVWTRTYDGVGNGNDELNDLTFDNAGNVAVTGTAKTNTGKDIATALYSVGGNMLWMQTYDYSAHLDDYGVKVVADNSGNVFTGGYGYNGNLNNDYVVLKYSSAGVQTAIGTFNGAESLDDEIADIAIDGAGNIIVTGESKTSANRDDYATVKFNSLLVQQWFKTLDQASKNDRATGIWVDAAGDVYVTGRSSNGSDDDYVTIKYLGANGANGWAQPKLYDSNGDDHALDIAGNANQVVVSGTKFNGLQKDIQTIAYNPSTGAVLWSTAYANANGKDEDVSHVAIGPNDAVIITGTTDGSASAVTDKNILLLKYNGSGALLFTKINGGGSNLDDNGSASLVDDDGNIYTAGALVLSNSMKDAFLQKHDAAGVHQFSKSYNGEGEYTDKTIALCRSGIYIYSTGYVYGYDEDRNFCTIKYDASGNKVWVKTFNGPDNDTDEPVAISGDGSGNIYVAGRSKNIDNNYDILVIKYNASGDTLWTRSWDGSLAGDDEARDMAVDATGNVYVTGVSDGESSLLVSNDYITLKYSSTGALQWAVPYNGNGGADDRAYAIALDNLGNAYVTGRTWNGNDFDIRTQKYTSANGTESAFATYASTLGDDIPAKIRIDANGNVVVAATSDRDATSSTNRDYLVIQYNSAGVQQWAKLYNGGGTGDDDISDMVVDGTGNVYVTGGSDLDSTATDNVDYLTVKYSNTGTELWARNYNGAANESDIAYALAVDAEGLVYVTGQADEGTPQARNNNAATVVYSAIGTQLQVANYNGSVSGTDAGSAILINNSSVYVAGYASNSVEQQKDIVLIKYSTPAGIVENANEGLLVYPNPCGANSQITIPGNGNAEIKMYNQLGELVMQQPVFNNAVINIGNKPAGIYFIHRLSNNLRTVTKLIVQ